VARWSARRRIAVAAGGLVLVALVVLAILLDRAVPSVVGLTVGDARVKLHNYQLHVKTKRPYPAGAIVCRQEPVVGRTVIEGATVTLYARHDCG
jgi:beta-lactam-binding protein with PASTA domain